MLSEWYKNGMAEAYVVYLNEHKKKNTEPFSKTGLPEVEFRELGDVLKFLEKYEACGIL